MALFTPPPDNAVGVSGELRGIEQPIFLIIPLSGDLRRQSLQIVYANHHPASRAERAPNAALGAGVDLGSPFVSLLTAPPDTQMRTGYHVLWR